MKATMRESYQKPLLELVKTESADICQAMSPTVVPGVDPLTPVIW